MGNFIAIILIIGLGAFICYEVISTIILIVKKRKKKKSEKTITNVVVDDSNDTEKESK